MLTKYFIASFILVSNLVFGQISGNTVTEYQHGNLPETKPQNLNTIYNRTIIQYNWKNFKAFTMLETFGSQLDRRSYFSPSQLGLYYSSSRFDVKLGNYFETIGRGNLLRSFEIPSSILEDRGFRARTYFFRDILGGMFKYKSKYIDIKLLTGKPLDNLYPPTLSFEVRRPETVSAINTELKYKKLKLGTAFMLHQNIVADRTYLSNYLSGTLFKNVQFFTEFSNLVNSSLPETKNTYAFYSGINFSKGKLGGSFEVKDYKNFLIGAGVNQPPAVVREHTYRVLNRSIHVLQPSNERGLQLELFYEPKLGQTITFNQTLNENDFGVKYQYSETFAEYNIDLQNDKNLKTFIDFANDGIKQEKQRISTGAQYEFAIYKKQKIRLEVEFQTLNRPTENVQNQVYAFTYRPTNKLSISPVVEISNDPFLSQSSQKYWFGAYAKYNATSKINLQLFAGKRRGGPSCNAGICYEVLDFEGVEARMNIRF